MIVAALVCVWLGFAIADLVTARRDRKFMEGEAARHDREARRAAWSELRKAAHNALMRDDFTRCVAMGPERIPRPWQNVGSGDRPRRQ